MPNIQFRISKGLYSYIKLYGNPNLVSKGLIHKLIATNKDFKPLEDQEKVDIKKYSTYADNFLKVREEKRKKKPEDNKVVNNVEACGNELFEGAGFYDDVSPQEIGQKSDNNENSNPFL